MKIIPICLATVRDGPIVLGWRWAGRSRFLGSWASGRIESRFFYRGGRVTPSPLLKVSSTSRFVSIRLLSRRQTLQQKTNTKLPPYRHLPVSSPRFIVLLYFSGLVVLCVICFGLLPHFGDKYLQKLSDLSRPAVLRRHFSSASSSNSPSVQNLTGAESKQKLLFVPNADNQPYMNHEISDPALFRFLLNEESLKQLDTAEAYRHPNTRMLAVLKDIDKDSQIIEFEIHRTSMQSVTDAMKAFHVFIVFKSTSETDGDYWWSLEKNTEYIVLQRSRNKDDVKNKLYGESRKQVVLIKEDLKGKGTIKYLFATFWAHEIIKEKYNIFNSNCQSFVTFVSKQMTQEQYDFKGLFQSPKMTENDQKTEMLTLINILMVDFKSWHPLFTLIYLENTRLFDEITKGGEYNNTGGITQYGLTLLDIAIMFANHKMVKHLLKPPYSVDPTTQNGSGMNALDMAAVYTKETKIIDLLLEHDDKAKKGNDGIDKHGYGTTALHFAAMTSNNVAAKHLIKKGADVNHRNKRGQTPLHVAALGAKDIKIIDILLRNISKGDVEQYKNDATLLPYAMHNDDHELGEEIFKRLVGKGIVSNEVLEALKAAKRRLSKCNDLGQATVSLMEQKDVVLEARIEGDSKQPNRRRQATYEQIRESKEFKADAHAKYAKEMDMVNLPQRHEDTNVNLLDNKENKALDDAMNNEHAMNSNSGTEMSRPTATLRLAAGFGALCFIFFLLNRGF
jgi:hypothetical protein